jgi:hypothetical protein
VHSPYGNDGEEHPEIAAVGTLIDKLEVRDGSSELDCVSDGDRETLTVREADDPEKLLEWMSECDRETLIGSDRDAVNEREAWLTRLSERLDTMGLCDAENDVEQVVAGLTDSEADDVAALVLDMLWEKVSHARIDVCPVSAWPDRRGHLSQAADRVRFEYVPGGHSKQRAAPASL